MKRPVRTTAARVAPRRRSALLAVTAAVAALLPAVGSVTPAQASSGHLGALAPTSLQVDGESSDAVVGGQRPTLSWVVNDSRRAEAQTAYQVVVEAAAVGKGGHAHQVWDSGRVRSADSVNRSYGGPALASNTTYTWSVRTWDRAGDRSPWSAPAHFDTALFSASDWSASWLRVADGALVRGGVDLPKSVARARLYFGAQGIVEPHVNGAVAEPDQVLNSTVTDYTKRVLYRDFDVTRQLVRGHNALAFMAGKGQFSGEPTFVAQLNVTYTDGTSATFGTGPAWRTTAGPVTGDDFYLGETYDARRAVTGWDTAGFDDSAWKPVVAVAAATHPQSLAQGRPVTSRDTTSCCGWSPAALTDGVDGSTDASQGYHSAVATTADDTKWVQVDLGSAQPLSGVRLFPARPTNDPAGDLPGAGFPVRYRVEAGDDPTFATATTLVDRTGADQPNPGTASVSIPAEVTARYVRVTATKLYCNGSGCNLRLAELGVYGAHPATVFSALTRLQADTTPPTRIVKTLKPVAVTHPVAGSQVYDFGQNIVGWVTVRASAPSGTTVDIKKGEILASDGQVTTSNISFGDGDPVRQTEHYTFAGKGAETYAPHFNYSGFRYAQLTGVPAGTAVTVTAQEVHSDVATTGQFDTSNTVLNSIQTALVQTQLNNLQSIPLDCPTREKHGWLGDAGDTDVEAMSNFDMRAFYDQWAQTVVTSAHPDGSLPSVAPTQGATDWFTDPAWGSAYPQIIWDSYTQYGDAGLVRANYAQVKSWVDYLGTISDSDHVVTAAPGSWGDDWVATVSTPHVFFQTGYYYLDATLLAKMAAVVGDTADARRYTDLARQIGAGFTKRFLDADTGVWSTGTQLAYAMPLVLGLVPAAQQKATVDRLVQDIAKHGNHVTTGFVGTSFVYQALGMSGRNDVALAVAERTDFPSFGYMVANGPGTIWEKWPNSSAADGTSSKDHIGLAGSIGQWYYQQLGGIQPDTGPAGAAYRAFTLAPSVVGDLTRVSARQRTARGTVVSAWQRDGSTLTYHAVVPVGSTATIKVPLLGGARSTVTESGRTIFADGRRGRSDPGLSVGTADGTTLTVTAGSGDYTFTVRPPRTPYTQVSVSAGAPAPALVKGDGGTTIGAVVEGHSTAPGATATVGADVPAGWTVTSTPARVPLTPASTATLANVKVTPPSGTRSGTYPVTVTVRSSDGTTAKAALEVLVLGSWPQGTTAAASSEHAPNVVDGATRTYTAGNAVDGDLSTFWNDDTDSRYPDTLTVTAPAPTTLNGVGFASHSDGVPTAFTVQTWDGAAWVTQADLTGNTDQYRWIPFAGSVTTTRVRVVVTAAQNSFTRIVELTP
ncbi:family 78 glycoside hydrolase catalytic domain [Streptomyces sp. NPDC008079]|uniref:family 78 glycoside hydrolase catalytic domain n=1 Tax=Streptomyces sp. NPDC008079 TaxID=3364806 RepID=UPI0036F06C2B